MKLKILNATMPYITDEINRFVREHTDAVITRITITTHVGATYNATITYRLLKAVIPVDVRCGGNARTQDNCPWTAGDFPNKCKCKAPEDFTCLFREIQ